MESAIKKTNKLHAFATSLLLTGLLAAGSTLANEPTDTSSTESMNGSGGSMSQDCAEAMQDSTGQCPMDESTGEDSDSGSTGTGTSGTGSGNGSTDASESDSTDSSSGDSDGGSAESGTTDGTSSQ